MSRDFERKCNAHWRPPYVILPDGPEGRHNIYKTDGKQPYILTRVNEIDGWYITVQGALKWIDAKHGVKNDDF